MATAKTSAAVSSPVATAPTAAAGDAKDSKSAAGSGAFVAHAHPTSNAAYSVASRPKRKVSIVGAGAVGCAVASSIIGQRLCSELCLIDVDAPKVQAEVLDFTHGMGAAQMPVAVYGGRDLALTAGSSLVVVSAGVRQRPGESRRDLLNRNAKVLWPVFVGVAQHSPGCVLLVISNPCDAMTYLAWKASGFPASRVFGSGTILDSSRFRALLAERLALPITGVHAHVIGEHGDASVPVWSSVNVFGTPLRTLYPLAATPADPDGWSAITTRVVTSAQELIKAKGYTSWGIGLCGAAIARSVLKDEESIVSLSTIVPAGHVLCAGAPGSAAAAAATFTVDTPVAMSLPCAVSAGGIKSIVKVSLDAAEAKALQSAANKLLELQALIDLTSLGAAAKL